MICTALWLVHLPVSMLYYCYTLDRVDWWYLQLAKRSRSKCLPCRNSQILVCAQGHCGWKEELWLVLFAILMGKMDCSLINFGNFFFNSLCKINKFLGTYIYFYLVWEQFHWNVYKCDFRTGSKCLPLTHLCTENPSWRSIIIFRLKRAIIAISLLN